MLVVVVGMAPERLMANNLTAGRAECQTVIIRISDEPTLWCTIDADSPLFVELRRRHAKSMGGRWPGFIIETADLRQLLDAVTGDAVVGELITGADARGARADEILARIEKWTRTRLAVEQQQDHASYLIHAGIGIQRVITWIGFPPESPLFVELRRRHTEWTAEHPG